MSTDSVDNFVDRMPLWPFFRPNQHGGYDLPKILPCSKIARFYWNICFLMGPQRPACGRTGSQKIFFIDIVNKS